MLVGTIGGGLLGHFSLSLPYLVRSGLLLATLAVSAAAMHEIGFTPRPVTWNHLAAEMGKVGRAGVTFGWRDPVIRLLIFTTFIQMGFLMWGWYAWQPYFLSLLGSDKVWAAGAIPAASALAMMVGNGMVEFLGRHCARRSTLLVWSSLATSVAMVGVGLAGSFWPAVSWFLLGMVAFGVVGPVKQGLLHKVVPSEHRATVVSFDSMFGNAGGIAGQTGLGALSEGSSIASGYVAGGLLTLLAVPFYSRLKRTAGDLDIGCEILPGQEASAAEGLPVISVVDTKAAVPVAAAEHD